MAKFLNTSATNYYLEELIKGAKEILILISPYLRLNDRVKELLEDKNRLKIDVRIVYGKSELHPQEIAWLRDLTFIRTSFCKNLHAKCYLNEESCIITSLNLYEFSQVNNNEIGLHVDRTTDAEVYRDAFEEAQRIIRISEEVRITVDKVATSISPEKPIITPTKPAKASVKTAENTTSPKRYTKLTSSKMAAKHHLKTDNFMNKMAEAGYISGRAGSFY